MVVDNLDKITFLNALEQELHNLPRNERDKIMYEYEQYFFEQESDGKNEYQIIGALESPKQIGKEIMVKNAIVSAEYRPNAKNIVKAIMASLGMGISYYFVTNGGIGCIYVWFIACGFFLNNQPHIINYSRITKSYDEPCN